MAVKDRTTAVVPYVQLLVSNRDAQASARQAAFALRAAYQRARGKDAEKIIQDKKLRREVTKAVAAISGLWKEVEESTPQQKPRWRGAAMTLGLAVAAGLVTIGPGKAWFNQLFAGNELDPETPPANPATLSTDPSPPS